MGHGPPMITIGYLTTIRATAVARPGGDPGRFATMLSWADDTRVRPDVYYVRNEDTSLAYQVVGGGSTDLLLVSGFVSNLEYAWEYPSLARFLSRLAEMSRLILTDRRGSGLSDRFRDAPTQETMLRDLEVVLDQVGSAKATLFGIWDGCNTSVLFAATHPERVSSLILFTASAAQRPAEDYPWAWDDDGWEEWLTSIRDGWGTRAWVVKNARWMGPSMLDHPEELERFISYTRVAASPSSAEAVMRNSSNTDIRDILPVVRTPTLVLHRAGDQIEPIEAGRYVAAKMPSARLVELQGDDGIPWIGDVDAVIREIRAFLGETIPAISADRRLATLLFTDIVGSTQRLAALGDAQWRELLAEHDELAKRAIAAHGGHYVESTGDGLLATFDGPAAAVRCAMALADAVSPLHLEIRAGCHTGEIELAGDHVRGIAVHTGARIAALAGPSEVLVSRTVRDLVAGSGLTFEDAGQHDLKGIPEPWQLYRLTKQAAAGPVEGA
jgi:class 3 adenylate cyclase/pimeloyl-ACP methyl ester carboxylesterase